MNNAEIEAIVRSVIAGMQNDGCESAAPVSNGAVPAKSKAAVLTELNHFDIKEFDIPELGDEDILVKVEGCGVCGTDAHEFKRDPFGLIPTVLGHEGTGEIVKMGKNVKIDSAGKSLKVGDKVVTCLNFSSDPELMVYDMNNDVSEYTVGSMILGSALTETENLYNYIKNDDYIIQKKIIKRSSR